MLSSEDARTLGPDGYSRFFVIIRLLEELHGGGSRPLRILDVGGCSPYLHQLLQASKLRAQLTVLDILPRPKELADVEYIQADVNDQTRLAENSYDVVVSTDTLEHVSPTAKDDFVRACLRLAKSTCIIAAPFDTPGVDEAEHLVNDFNQQLFGVGQDWLEEHFKFSKPSIDSTVAVFKQAGVVFEHFGTNNLYSWITSSHLNLIEAKMGLDSRASRQARIQYNSNLATSLEFVEPTYRHFFVASKTEADLVPVVQRLTGHQPNPSHYLHYLHEMMSATAVRLGQLKTETEQQHDELYGRDQKIAELAKASHEQADELKRTTDELAALRQRLAPLKPVVKAAKTIRQFANRKKRG